jgi:hypothetical protein
MILLALLGVNVAYRTVVKYYWSHHLSKPGRHVRDHMYDAQLSSASRMSLLPVL